MRAATLLRLFLVCLLYTGLAHAQAELTIEQITFGPKHHFFGYIGQCRTIPWNASGRYILSLETDFQDRMTEPNEPATIVLLDTQDNYKPIPVAETRGWNFQQGTMFYWNPRAPETQFFFNDRDPATGKVFCVLYDIADGLPGKRLHEFKFDDTPVGNGGVAQNGAHFLAINYARMARLRPVTGYPGANDWTVGVNAPADDGIFIIDVETGAKRLLVSFEKLRDTLAPTHPGIADKPLFINHTLWSRDDSLIYFYARGEFETKERVNVPFTIRPDGSELTPLTAFIGGHPEWLSGHELIGSAKFGGENKRQVVYDVKAAAITRAFGEADTFPDPEGDISLSPNGEWLANGFRKGGVTRYVIYGVNTGAVRNVTGFAQTGYTTGELRVDPSPCWNRESTAILFPSLSNDEAKTRQIFVVRGLDK